MVTNCGLYVFRRALALEKVLSINGNIKLLNGLPIGLWTVHHEIIPVAYRLLRLL